MWVEGKANWNWPAKQSSFYLIMSPQRAINCRYERPCGPLRGRDGPRTRPCSPSPLDARHAVGHRVSGLLCKFLVNFSPLKIFCSLIKLPVNWLRVIIMKHGLLWENRWYSNVTTVAGIWALSGRFRFQMHCLICKYISVIVTEICCI